MTRELSNAAAAALLTSWGLLMRHAYGKRAAKRKEMERKTGEKEVDRSLVLKERRYTVDHPVFGWLFENGAVWMISVLRLLIVREDEGAGPWQRQITTYIGLNMSDRLFLITQHILCTYVYPHIPRFHDDGPRPDGPDKPPRNAVSTLIWDYLRTTCLSHTFILLIFHFIKPVRKHRFNTVATFKALSPLAFLAKLAIARAIVDVAFFCGHWIIHRPRLFHHGDSPYPHPHPHPHPRSQSWGTAGIMNTCILVWCPYPRNPTADPDLNPHPHPTLTIPRSPRLLPQVTNQHFTVPDLFVEACDTLTLTRTLTLAL